MRGSVGVWRGVWRGFGGVCRGRKRDSRRGPGRGPEGCRRRASGEAPKGGRSPGLKPHSGGRSEESIRQSPICTEKKIRGQLYEINNFVSSNPQTPGSTA